MRRKRDILKGFVQWVFLRPNQFVVTVELEPRVGVRVRDFRGVERIDMTAWELLDDIIGAGALNLPRRERWKKRA